jgi:uncharacterized protein YbjT (DUF2867 family)
MEGGREDDQHATMTDPLLVLGATGSHGGAVAHALLAREFTVHVLVRDPNTPRAQALAEAGATLVSGDLLDEDSLVRAFGEVGAVYAVTTPFEHGAEDEERQGSSIINAAGRVGLEWLILASVAASDRAAVPHFQSKARIEKRLRETTIPWTVIAPSYFYENLLSLRESICAGSLPLALPAHKPLHQVALADLGALVAAVVSRREEHLSSRVEVAGEAPTPLDMASAVGAHYRQVPIAEIRKRSVDLALMYEFLASEGYGIDVPRLRQRYPEVPWTSFVAWARDIDWSARQ